MRQFDAAAQRLGYRVEQVHEVHDEVRRECSRTRRRGATGQLLLLPRMLQRADLGRHDVMLRILTRSNSFGRLSPQP